MGMEGGPQTWLHIRSKVRRERFKIKQLLNTPLLIIKL